MSADPKRVETLFHTALNLPPADRAAFLAVECGADAELLGRVECLLAAHADLGTPAPDVASPTGTFGDAAHTADHTPQTDAGTLLAGKYKLLEEIGEGGMGTVWMAEQTEPVRRRVAVKLIKPGMDSRAVLARFEVERQALALMDHPNIAKVLDAGATQDGRPFFVMELVKGVPITAYCDEHKLTPRQRLELFVPVCQAIQHAHQKGVIHRDIKPSNVLVAMYDDKPVPKVIDFGVSKATGQPLTEKTLATGFGAVVGTPEYMSPEQASFNNLDIDTRSDVYALGVLLYELLAGAPPFSRKELEKVGLLEIFRVIREQEPPPPSTKLSTAEALPTLSANRGTEPKRLTALLRGELDLIVMKALEKDRNRRYETANGLGADVQRFLAGEPVQAVPPSVGYRLRKFLRKNRGPVFAVAVTFLALVLGVVGTTVGLVSADRLRRAAEAAEVNERQERTKAEAARKEADELRQKTERNLRVLADASAVLFDDTDDAVLYDLFRTYVYASDDADEARRPLRERIGDLERALAGSVPDAVAASRLRLYLALHHLKDACRRGPEEEALRGCTTAIGLLESEVNRGPMLDDGGYFAALEIAYGLRGRLLADLDRTADAIADYRRVLETGGNDPDLALECLRLALTANQFEIAELAVAALTSGKKGNHEHCVRGGLLCALASANAPPGPSADRPARLALKLFDAAIEGGSDPAAIRKRLADPNLKRWKERKDVSTWLEGLDDYD